MESDDELHSIDWSLPQRAFDYTDDLLQPPMIAAVVNNDSLAVRALLASGKSINNNDNLGNTPLHVAVKKKRKDVFDFLLTVEEIRLEPENFERATPLSLALLVDDDDYFAMELIRKGADVNLGLCYTENTHLHIAVHQKRKNLAHILIEKGANLDAMNFFMETPLVLACRNGFDEIIYMLLYYGADATVPTCTDDIAFSSYLQHGREETEEILLETTFGEEETINMKILINAMTFNSPTFANLIKKTKNILYTSEDLYRFNKVFRRICMRGFKLFISKFPHIVKETVNICDTLTTLLPRFGIVSAPYEILEVLCDYGFGSALVSNISTSQAFINKLLEIPEYKDTPLANLEGIIFCLLSYGLAAETLDFYTVYSKGGYCLLFKVMLHIDHVFINHCQPRHVSRVMCSIIVDYTWTIKQFCTQRKPNQLNVIEELISYSSIPDLKRLCLGLNNEIIKKKAEMLPQVPPLLEQTRDAIRQHLANQCKPLSNEVSTHCKHINCNEFYTRLQNLPIPDVCKKILSYEKKLYYFSII